VMPLQTFLYKIREAINLRIYSGKTTVLLRLRLMRVLVGLGLLGLMVYHYGMPQTIESREWNAIIIRGSFYFFFFSYLLRVFYEFKPFSYILGNWQEGLLLFIMLLEGVFSTISGVHFFRYLVGSSDNYYLLLQLLLLLLAFIETGKASQRLGMMAIKPAMLFFLSFIVLISVGTSLLLMPEMTVSGYRLSFLEALFTSVSASSVTGLIVVDTSSIYTFKGQVVILMLFQLGGLNIISFASFFGAFLRKGVGIRANSMIKDFMSYDSMASTRSMLTRVISFALFIELVGFLLVYISWDTSVVFKSTGERVFYSLFHAVSAFTNAGFSVFSQGIYTLGVRESYLTQIVLMILIFLGGIGIPVMNDLFDRRRMQMRLLFPWKRLEVNSRLALYTSFVLIGVGAIFLYLLEYGNYKQHYTGGLHDHSVFGQCVTLVFQSVSLRSGGLNSLDFSLMGTPILLFFCLLMFIGASPGGTGGGIKTTTFALVFLSAISTIRQRKNSQIFRRSVSSDLMYRAFSIFLFTASGIFLGVFLLSITDGDKPLIHLLFEEVSAFATVGLSAGITADLSVGGKVVLMISMLVGRVGVLTVAFMVSSKAISNNYKYPEAKVMLG
jgi:trk system potassium uptake protein TrkH